MRDLPADFPISQLVDVLEAHWHPGIRAMEYLPVGFGAYHWRVTTSTYPSDLFLSVHDLDLVGRFDSQRQMNFELLRKAFSTAHWLESVAELDFVLGPLPDRVGSVLRLVADRFALHVYPWADAEELVDLDSSQTATLIGGLHSVTDRLPPDMVPVEDFVLPHRDTLDAALSDMASQWRTGPYAEAARDALRRHADEVRALMAFYQRTAGELAGSRSEWVLTHGEPGGRNLIQTADGRPRLVDWDTVMLAPRERDLWELQPDAGALGTYLGLTSSSIRPQRLSLYKAWYALAEVAVYLKVFRSPHIVDENTSLSWQNFLRFLPTRQEWPEI